MMGLAKTSIFVDYKSQLRRKLTSRLYRYRVLETPRPPASLWIVGVERGSEIIGRGQGKSKRSAEHKAAKEALRTIREEGRAVQKLIGAIGTDRGRRAEQKVVEAFSEPHEERPHWIRSIRFATKKEDAEGVDAVIDTHDIGYLFIQVKSSHRGAKRFERQGRRSRLIGVIVVHDDEDLSVVRAKLRDIVMHLRTQIEALRGQTG